MTLPDEIEAYFKENGYPEGTFDIAPGERVFDSKLFVESTIKTLRVHSGVKTYRPYFERLVKFYNMVRL